MATNPTMQWKTLIEDSSLKTKQLPRNPAREHPLKLNIVTERIPRRILSSQSSTGRTTPVSTPSSILEPLSAALEGVDPLTAFAIEEMDPLSKLAAEEAHSAPSPASKRPSSVIAAPQSWASKKASILSKFTTNERLSIVTSFLSDGEKVVVKAQSTAVDKVQHRLEQLDQIDEGSQTRFDVSQSEYIGRIDQLNRELVNAWNSEQRVKSLKIAIQCAKLLSDTTVLPFYPSKFVLVTDILDVFGQLVYNRLRNKADSVKKQSGNVAQSLPENFTPEMVSDAAKETCLNWFYKIASIRELVPRLYVEMALIRCYTFLSNTGCNEALTRIVKMIHGIGNPLVAVYARCYLCRIGRTLPQGLTNDTYLLRNLHHFLHGYAHIFSRCVGAELSAQKIPMPTYMTLYTPALDFMLESLISSSSDPKYLLDELMQRCKSDTTNSSLLLNAIMSAFRPNLITTRVMDLLEMIEYCTDQEISVDTMLRTLGLCVSVRPPPAEQHRLLLQKVWTHVRELRDPGKYMSCAEPWIIFVVRNFTYREINAIVGNIIEHISKERNRDSFSAQLKYIVENIIDNVQDFESLLIMDNFLPLLDLFHDESIKVELCKKILLCPPAENVINDAVVINALMYLASILHDSVNALSPEDECRQIGEILCQTIRSIDYGRDFEQQLTFYVEARGSFANIDTVLGQLVQCVNTLSAKTTQIVRGQHNRKTGDFVRACAAYAFITIPAIKSAKSRLKLYLLSGQAALFSQCLGQADACFKAALTLISGLDSLDLSEPELVVYFKQFLSLLLIVPDNPACSVLNLLRGLLKVVQGHAWETNASISSVYLSALDLLAAMAQEWYPYHIEKVESNDALYGSDPKFINEVDKICSILVNETQRKLNSLDSGKKQADLALELLTKLALRSQLDSQGGCLGLQLWKLAQNNASSDKKYMIRTKSYLKSSAISKNSDNDNLQALLDKLA